MSDSLSNTAPPGRTWLPSWFSHPTHLELDSGHHLRPLRAVDLDLDLPAVRGSRDALWARFGPAWGWPPADLTADADLRDLQRQEQETSDHVSFSYGVLDEAEEALAGCVYLDPPRGPDPSGPGRSAPDQPGTDAPGPARPGTAQHPDADVSWWIVDALRGSALDHALPGALREWLARDWPFTRPRLVGLDIGWGDWARLPDPA